MDAFVAIFKKINRLCSRLFGDSFLAAERHVKEFEEFRTLFICLGGRDNRDIESDLPSASVDRDLGKDSVIFDSERVVAAAIKTFLHSAEVADNRESDRNHPVEKIIHLIS